MNMHRLEPDLEVIRHLVDQLISEGQDEEIEANLYSARIHLTRALNELRKKAVAA